MKHVGYTLVGFALYYIPSIPVAWILDHICQPPAAFDYSFCAWFRVILPILALIFLPLAILQAHRTGQRFCNWIMRLRAA